ncbi:MAG: hypothetical protein ACE5F1_03780 [Planctomycetota bacterium]
MKSAAFRAGAALLVTSAASLSQGVGRLPGFPGSGQGQTGQTGQTGRTQEQTGTRLGWPWYQQGQSPGAGWPSLWGGYPSSFPQGYPTWPPPLQGGGLTFGQIRSVQTGVRTPTPAESSRWPSWVQLGGPGRRVVEVEEMPAHLDPKRCLLMRLSDTVLVKPEGEKSYFPLAFWKKSRLLKPGGTCRVQAGGRLLLIFSDGTRIEMHRAGELRFVQGSADRLLLHTEQLTLLSGSFGSREVVLRLPEGSLLRGSRLDLSIRRERRTAPWAETGVEDRFRVRNWGPAKLGLDPGGDRANAIEIGQNRRSILPLVSGRALRALQETPMSWTLQGGGVPIEGSLQATPEKTGKVLELSAQGSGAELSWGGVHFRLPADRRLWIDPLGGDPFGDGRPVPVGEHPPDKSRPEKPLPEKPIPDKKRGEESGETKEREGKGEAKDGN